MKTEINRQNENIIPISNEQEKDINKSLSKTDKELKIIKEIKDQTIKSKSNNCQNNNNSINNMDYFYKNIIINQNYNQFYFNLENFSESYNYNDTVPSTKYIISMSIILSKEKIGSKLVQMEYERGNDEIKNEIFETLKKQIVPLSEDIYGNYVIQKILISRDSKKIDFIFESLKELFFGLSKHQNGCRVLQTLIQILSELKDNKKIKIFVDILIKNNISTLFYDQNGNHVIQKLIDVLDGENINYIYSTVLKNIKSECENNLLFNKYGSRIVQSLLYKFNELQKGKEKENNLIDKIFENNFDELCQNQYSNYILQFFIEKHKNKIEFICTKLKGNIYKFSRDNYASYIIQKVIDNGNGQQRDQIGKEILENDHGNNNKENSIMQLVKHKNGNFVIQKIIQFCSSDIKNEIIKKINNSNDIKRGKYSKYVSNIIERYNSSSFK